MNKRKIIYAILIIAMLVLVGIFLIKALLNESRANNKTSEANSNIKEFTNKILEENKAHLNELIIDLSKENNVLEEPIINQELKFELPIEGSTGYAPIVTDLRENNSRESKKIGTIGKGEAFNIISEKENWWYVKYNEKKGWVENTLCMINLPDIIPSIVYDDTNAYSSIFKSSGYNLPNVTSKKLYEATTYNERLEKNEYNMPILYQMAKKIYLAQKKAMENNESLKIYETYRPYEVQMKVVKNLKELMKENETVEKGINTGSWNESWFIAQSLSNHQLGVAMDVSLVKINKKREKKMGSYTYLEITDYTEYEMPTKMHELSTKAVTFKYGVSSASKTEWKKVPLATTMTEPAKRLQNYCTSSDLSPLASEWWHFNDLDAKATVKGKKFDGRYYLKNSVSTK